MAKEPVKYAEVGIVGRTNGGKSTLVNQLVGEKVSIVSPVVQTTRTTVRGVLTEERGQLVLLDTPGLHRSRTVLGTAMNKAARASASGADAVLLVSIIIESQQDAHNSYGIRTYQKKSFSG